MAVVLSTLWCVLQGAIGFIGMQTHELPVMVLCATLIMGAIGPICARNYSAPHLAVLLVCLCDVPFAVGGALSGDRWLLIMLPMTPPFLLGMSQIIMTFNKILVSALVAEERNQHLAHHDALTGLLNRQGLDGALARLGSSEDWMFSILCIDLDGFKLVNDTHGHGAGDALLQAVGERLARNIRPGDIAARIGGDEFLIVVRKMDPDAIARTAERLIASIAEPPYDVGGIAVRVGTSIGYACFPEDAMSIAELRSHADHALYAAKRAGKGVRRRYDADGIAA